MFDKGQAMLLWALECQPEQEAEWNEWYNLEHFAALVRVPGFISGNRYRKIGETASPPPTGWRDFPRYLTFYELYDEKVLQSEAYHVNRNSAAPGMRPHWTKRMLSYITRVTGGTYRPLTDTWLAGEDRSAHLLWAIFLEPEEKHRPALDRWCAETLLPALRSCPGITASRLMGSHGESPAVAGGAARLGGPARIVLCAVADAGVPATAASAAARAWGAGQSLVRGALGVLYERLSVS
jgi:hypothetical protein